MKTVSANPDLIEMATTWAQANPMEAIVGMFLAWGAFCFYKATRYSF